MTLFGTLADGREIHRISLQNSNLGAEILTMGAIVQDLRLEGIPHPLVLGAPDKSHILWRSGPTKKETTPKAEPWARVIPIRPIS